MNIVHTNISEKFQGVDFRLQRLDFIKAVKELKGMHCILFCLTLKTESCTVFHHPFTSANPYQGHRGGVGGRGRGGVHA